MYFQPCHRLKSSEAEEMNKGLNVIVDNQWRRIGEVDRVMQALHLFPDDQSISQIKYNVENFYTRLANQSLPMNWRLQMEKIGSMAAQPTEIPQFNS